VCPLYMPMMTSNNRMAIRNSVLSSSFEFINCARVKLDRLDRPAQVYSL
jgi:hypothetical protein